jgi:hypothetical protein
MSFYVKSQLQWTSRVADQALMDGVGDASFQAPNVRSASFRFTLFAQEGLAAIVIGPGLVMAAM